MAERRVFAAAGTQIGRYACVDAGLRHRLEVDLHGDPSPLRILDAAVSSLYVADLDAAIHWYEAMLGLQPVSVGDDVHPDAAYQLGGTLSLLARIEAALGES